MTAKPHLAVEQGQKAMSIVITAGQRGDSPQFEVVLGRIRVARLGPRRPRVRPRRVRADRAYASRKNRAHLRRRGIRCTIPDKADQARNRRRAPHLLVRGSTAFTGRWSRVAPVGSRGARQREEDPTVGGLHLPPVPLLFGQGREVLREVVEAAELLGGEVGHVRLPRGGPRP
ncbi:transposase [Streptomyces yangpuensis]|uniref:transposase n=1 Tax=Streptomyces yangpuensis TaxID=1648182 RepID=UPI00364A0E48